MKCNLIKTFIILTPVLLFPLLSSNNAFAGTQWAGVKGAPRESGIMEVPEDYALTAVGAGGTFDYCNLWIKTAPVIDGDVDFSRVSDWTWALDTVALRSPVTCPTPNLFPNIQKSADYISNTVITGWTWQIDYGLIPGGTICYYQEYAPLSDINNRSDFTDRKSGSCKENRGENIPKVVASAPRNNVIVAVGFSTSHGGTVSGLMASRRKAYSMPVVVQQKTRFEENRYVYYESPASQDSPVQLGTGKSVRLMVSKDSGDFAENGPYTWSISGGGEYDPVTYQNAGRYSAPKPDGGGSYLTVAFTTPGQKILTLTSANGKTGSAYIEVLSATPVDLCLNLEGNQATVPGGLVQDESGNCLAPFVAPTCEITAPAEADRKTNTPIAIRASGGDGTYAWSVVPDGSITSNSSNSATAVFNTPDEKWISVDSAGMSGACRVEIIAQDICPNISGNQQTIPDGMSIDDAGNCVALPVTRPSCEIVSPRIWERKIDTPITARASGGDGSYAWDFLLSRFLNNTLWKGTILESFGDTAVMSFASSGAKIITVSSSGLTNECVAVILGAASPEPESGLTCEIKSDSLADQKPGALLSVEASGGSGAYEWSVATEGNITPNSPSNTASAIFAKSGTNVVNVSSGEASGSCSIFLFEGDSEPEPEEPTEEYPKVNCFPSEQTVEIGERVNFSATGGDNNYSWSSPAVPGSPNNTASAIFNSQGRKVVDATSAGSTGFCVVDVSSPAPTVNVWSAPRTDFTLPFEGPATVTYYIHWDSDYADSCTASWTGDIGRSGSQSFTNGRGTYNYRVTCINESGEDSDSATVTIREVPICDFTAKPVTIVPPQTSTLEWECRYAQSCSIDKGQGSVSNTGGTKTVRPTETTEFTLSCSGMDGDSSDSATVSIDFIPWLKEVIPIW